MTDHVAAVGNSFDKYIGTVAYSDEMFVSVVLKSDEYLTHCDRLVAQAKINEAAGAQLKSLNNKYGFRRWNLSDVSAAGASPFCGMCRHQVIGAGTPIPHPVFKSHRMIVCRDAQCALRARTLVSATTTASKETIDSSAGRVLPTPQHSMWLPYAQTCVSCHVHASGIGIVHHPQKPQYVTQCCTACSVFSVLDAAKVVRATPPATVLLARAFMTQSPVNAKHFHNRNLCGCCHAAIVHVPADEMDDDETNLTVRSISIGYDNIFHPKKKCGTKPKVAKRCWVTCGAKGVQPAAVLDDAADEWINDHRICSVCHKQHTAGMHASEQYYHPHLRDLSATTCGTTKCNGILERFINACIVKIHDSKQQQQQQQPSTIGAVRQREVDPLDVLTALVPQRTPFVVTWFYKYFAGARGQPLKCLEQAFLKFDSSTVVQHGATQGWFPNAQPSFTQNYFQGLAHGMLITFWSDGTIKQVSCANDAPIFVLDTSSGNSGDPNGLCKRVKISHSALAVESADQLPDAPHTLSDFCLGQSFHGNTTQPAAAAVAALPTSDAKAFRLGHKYTRKFSSKGVALVADSGATGSTWATDSDTQLAEFKTRDWTK